MAIEATKDAVHTAGQPERSGIGLALSGGGFRAALFHMGVLRYLAEAGQLANVRTISTVSGGSIFGAYVAAHWDELARQSFSAAAYESVISVPFAQVLTARNLRNRWLAASILRLPRLLLPSYNRADVLAELLDRWLYGGKMMQDLPPGLDLVINATSLATGRQFRWRRDNLGEWQFGYPGYGDHPIRLAYAVMASSAAPIVTPPLRIDAGPYAWDKARPQGDLWFADGGIYDNLGLEWFLRPDDTTDIVIVCEASGVMRLQWQNYSLGGLLGRAQGIQYEQSHAVRLRWLQDQFALQRRLASMVKAGTMEQAQAGALAGFTRKGVILSIDKAASDLDWVPAHSFLPDSVVARVARIRTDLDCFLPEEVELLSYHGYELAHAYLSSFQPQMAVREPAWQIDLSPQRMAAYDGVLAGSGKTFARGRKMW